MMLRKKVLNQINLPPYVGFISLLYKTDGCAGINAPRFKREVCGYVG